MLLVKCRFDLPMSGHGDERHTSRVSSSAPIRRVQLGRELRRMREDAHVTREAAAAELECDLSKISKMETGKLTLRAAEVRALLTLYRVPDDRADVVLQLAREARRRTAYRVPDWARTYVGLEAEAVEIKTYQTELVPGLLQTEAYARAVTRAADPTRDPAEVERMVATRQDRQTRLLADDGPRYGVVLNEAVVRRQVGEPEVMHDQLAWLVEVSERPRISVQVLPFTAGAHAAMGSSFVLLRLGTPTDVQVAYLEDLWSADYVDRPAQIAAYTNAFDRLSVAALHTHDSIAMINDVRKAMT